jgi:hypothetical protein
LVSKAAILPSVGNASAKPGKAIAALLAAFTTPPPADLPVGRSRARSAKAHAGLALRGKILNTHGLFAKPLTLWRIMR